MFSYSIFSFKLKLKWLDVVRCFEFEREFEMPNFHFHFIACFTISCWRKEIIENMKEIGQTPQFL